MISEQGADFFFTVFLVKPNSSWGASQFCNDTAFEESVKIEGYIEIALAQGSYGTQDFYK